MTTEFEGSLGGLPTLYRHKKRQDWGFAVLADEREDRRTFQFHDGRQRTFKRGWYELMKPLDQPDAETASIARRLSGELERSMNRQQHVDIALDDLLTLAEQIEALRADWEGGFAGDAWAAGVRGPGEGNALKRHRDPVIERAAETLSAERLTGEDAEGAWADVLRLLSATDIVAAKSDISPMEGASVEKRARVMETLADALHGEGEYSSRFDAYMDALTRARGGVAASWPLATVLQALGKPEEHIAVRTTAFRDQAHWTAPRLKPGKDPRGNTYVAYLNMAFTVKADLERAGLVPRDLMDVYDFIRLTRTRKVADRFRKRP